MADPKFPFELFLHPYPDNQLPSLKSAEGPNVSGEEQGALNNQPDASSLQQKNLSSAEISTINQEILFELKKKLGPQKFNAYFNDVFQIRQITGNLIEFSVTTNFIKTIIEKNFFSSIQDCLLNVLGKNFEVHLTCLNKKTNSSQVEASEQAGEDKKNLSAKDVRFSIDLLPNPETAFKRVESTISQGQGKFLQTSQIVDGKKTFDSFVIGPSNNMAYASVYAMACNPGRVYPSIYLHGNSGLGKTHLLHAAANKIKTDFPQLRISFITARDFMTEMIDALSKKSIHEFRKKYTEKVDVLLIDDIQELKNKIGTQNEFFHVFNELYLKGKQLFFTSDKPPQEIDGLEERIKTRLSWGLVLDIHAPDLETRIAILKRKTETEDIFLPDDVIHLIANSIQHNIRELEASLIKLGAYASIMHADIDVDVAKRQLKLDSHSKEEGPITGEKIIIFISQYYKIPVVDIKSKVRHKKIAHARHIAIYLMYKLTNQTLHQIGQFFYQKDHSSALHAVEKIKEQMIYDAELLGLVQEFEQGLKRQTFS